MVGSSSKLTPRILSGQGFPAWSEKVKKKLISEGVWHLVESGYKEAARLNDSETKVLEQHKSNDKTALFLIRQSLSTPISDKITDAETSKEAWDRLHDMRRASNQMASEEASNHEESVKTVRRGDTVGRKIASKTSKRKRKFERKESSYESDDNSSDEREDGNGGMPLTGDICLTKSAVNPPYHLNFPAEVIPMLPSTSVVAKLRCYKKTYEISFHGKRKPKQFGASGWKKLVWEHNLVEGDLLKYEITESNDTKLDINIQVLRYVIRPPDFDQEEIRKRKSNKAKPIIIISDDDDEENEHYGDE